MEILYNLLIAAGCMPEHASGAVATVAVLSVYVLYRTIIGLVNPSR